MRGQVLDAPRDLVGDALAMRLRVIPELQVLDAVVVADAVDVMDRLGGRQGAPEVLLHHDPMHQYLSLSGVECEVAAALPNPSQLGTTRKVLAGLGAVAPRFLPAAGGEHGAALRAWPSGGRNHSEAPTAFPRTERREEVGALPVKHRAAVAARASVPESAFGEPVLLILAGHGVKNISTGVVHASHGCQLTANGADSSVEPVSVRKG